MDIKVIMEQICTTFPDLEGDLYQYIKDVFIENEEHMESTEDIMEAIGELLAGVDPTVSESDIESLCKNIYDTLSCDDKAIEETKLLNPININNVTSQQSFNVEEASIWIAKREENFTVDTDKLEKAEAKIKEKKEKRAQTGLKVAASQPANNVQALASVSQQSNRKFTTMEASGRNRNLNIVLNDFDVNFGSNKLLDSVSLSLSHGRRYGFIGRNGLGKTTLLKLISHRELKIPSHISILHVEQEVVGDDTLALDSVLESDVERTRLLSDERRLRELLAREDTSAVDAATATAELQAVYEQCEALEVDKAPARAAVILSGLGFSSAGQRAATRTFSGGWRMRLALARALFSKPDLLLLDEPTNMLDMKAIIWLENYLARWPSTILVVSHDRAFLNAVATDIVLLHSARLEPYKGNFEDYAKTRAEKLLTQQREYDAQMEFRAHAQEFIDKFRYNAKRASLVQSKIKMLEKLPVLVAVEKERVVQLRFPTLMEKLSPPILQLDEVTFSYPVDARAAADAPPPPTILRSICANANMESRICIVGENGAGKSTLLKLLLGLLEPVAGIRHVHRNLKIGYFAQHHVDTLDLRPSPLEFLARTFPGRPAESYRFDLGGFGLSGDIVHQPIRSLSGGQKARLALCVMVIPQPNFIILDEPTNHLDMETIEALAVAINKFQGGIILVSHDERLIDLVCKELWLCENGGLRVVEGGLQEYRRYVERSMTL